MPTVHTPVFGRLLRQYRAAAGLTQEALAERAGLSPKSIGDLETGRRQTPRKDTLALLEEALHLASHERAALNEAARRLPFAADVNANVPSRSSQMLGQGTEPVRLERLLANSSVQQNPSLPLGAFLGAAPEGALVGRRFELSSILTGVGAAKEGSGRFLVVAGEPGVGKTRLAQEVMLACRDRGFLVATGRCYEPHRTVPFYPFLEVLSSLHGSTPDPLRSELATRWPALLQLLPEQPLLSHPIMAISQHEEQQRLFWAMSGFLQALSEVRPVALLLDDLHWSDDSSIELLQHITRHTRAHHILLLGTYRHVEVGHHHPIERALRDLDRERLAERVVIHRLGRDDTAQLIANMLGQDVPPEFADLIHGHTDGNPLFVYEVLRALIEREEIYRQDGQWDCKKVTSIEVPYSMRATIADRVSRLSASAQEALHAASVLGQTFTFEDLQATEACSEDTLDEAMEEALAAGLVQETTDGYGFNHALTQQALYVGLSVRRRRRLHLAAGDALERLPERLRQHRAAEMEWHFREGGAPERSLPYALLAGNYAASMYCAVEAERHYQAALDLAEKIDNQAGEARALEKLGWLMWMQARFDTCADLLERSAQRYHELGDVEGEMRTVAQLGMLHFTSSPLEGAQRVTALLDQVATREPSRPLAWLHISLALNLLIVGRYRETVAVAAHAAEIALALGDRRMLVWAETTRGPALGMMGQLAEARQVLDGCIPLAEAMEDYFGLLSAVHYLGDICAAEGDFAAASGYYSRALELAERLGAQSRISAETANLAVIKFYLGDWEQAHEIAERAAEIAYSVPSGRTASYFQYADVFRRLGRIRAAMGEWQEGAHYMAESVALAQRVPYPEAIRNGQRILEAHEILQQSDPNLIVARIELLVNGADPAELSVARLQPTLALAYAQLAQYTHADSILTEGIKRAHAQQHRLALVELLTVHGIVLSMQGRWQESRQVFEEAILLARSLMFPYAEGQALYELGRMHCSAREGRDALQRLEEALAIFRRLGARSDIARAEQVVAEIGQI